VTRSTSGDERRCAPLMSAREPGLPGPAQAPVGAASSPTDSAATVDVPVVVPDWLPGRGAAGPAVPRPPVVAYPVAAIRADSGGSERARRFAAAWRWLRAAKAGTTTVPAELGAECLGRLTYGRVAVRLPSAGAPWSAPPSREPPRVDRK
jgi:hypothetical protein